MKKRLFSWILICCLALGSCSVDDGTGGTGNLGGGGSQIENGNNGNNQGGTQGGSQNGTQGGGNVNQETCVDTNDDGVCDDCQKSVLVSLDIFAVNDLHGKVLDGNSHPGVDELSTYLKNARAENPNTIFLSSGDMWQGVAASNLTGGKLVTEWMNEMDFVSMTLGNHEYDWGEEAIEENAELAEFPFLAINIYDNYTNERVEYCEASVMVEQGGLKIGIIGAMGDCYNSISSDKVAGVTFKTGSELTALVKAEAQSLRNRGADCIIYSIHDGHGNCDSSLSNYVDVVFEGHTHTAYVNQVNGIYHLQGGGDNKGITHAELTVNFARNESETKEAEVVYTSQYTHLDGDSVVDLVASRYSEEVQIACEPLGKNDRLRESYEISSLVAKLYYEAGVKKWGSQYEIALGGGSLNLRSPYKIFAGEVVFGDVYDVLTFDNQLELCSVKGSVLKSRFINNSEYFVYCNSTLTSNIVDTNDYYVVLDTWSSRYYKNQTTVIARYDETTFARNLLADYIRKGGWTTQTEEDSEEDSVITLTSIPEIISKGNALADNGETSEYYYVKGRIISFDNTEYGNCTIVDENGNELYVYGINDNSGNRYDTMTNPPQVGDTVILKSVIKRYVAYGSSKVEFFHAVLISIE